MRSTKQAPVSAEDLFWRAIEFGVRGTVDEDVADVGRYVASRGDAAVAEFGVELGKAVTALRDAGVSRALERYTTTTDGRAFADLSESDQDHGLETLILDGRRDFEKLLANPEREGTGPGTLRLVDLRQAVERARAEPGIDAVPLWQERPGDRRRDGRRWLELTHGLGVGLSWNAEPWSIPGFLERFEKVALLRSFDDSWRAWRSSIGARTVSVSIEYSLPGHEPERVDVWQPGRAVDVAVYRDFSRLSVPGDPLQIAELEAGAVLDEVRATLSSAGEPETVPSPGTGEPAVVIEEDTGLPVPHPAFAAHFIHPLYDDVGDEDAPFGSDEGADMVANWTGRRAELGPTSTVADVLEADPAEYVARNDYESAQAVQVAAFTLLRLTGHIDPAGKKTTLAALAQLQSFPGQPLDPEEDPYEQQRRDLLSFEE